MSRVKPPRVTRDASFDAACSLVEHALAPSIRERIIRDGLETDNLAAALLGLRESMRRHAWKVARTELDLSRSIQKFDRRTRIDGFHVLNDWDGIADNVNPDIIPVDVLHYLIEQRGEEAPDETALAILVDYYFFHILSLLSLRIWDEGDADANLDRLQMLLDDLQGAHGSGQQFVADAETLILIATSHYELNERGYVALLEKVRTLNREHQTNIALGHASSMGSHLRFGFEATYGRDTVNMRNDNAADYPWLCYALATVMRTYDRYRAEGVHGIARERVVEALLNGLSPDARAFLGAPPDSLAACEAERRELRDRVQAKRPDLLEEFQRLRPADHAYSPLAFFFNFSHNVIKGTVVDALLSGSPWRVSFNDLLTGVSDKQDGETKETLARTLMAYARLNPHSIRGQLMPVIVYDPDAGRQAFAVTMRKLRESGSSAVAISR